MSHWAGLVLTAAVALLLIQCATAAPPDLVQNVGIEYTWIAGNTTIAETTLPLYGTLDVPDPTNDPGTRISALSWLFVHPVTGNATVYMYGGRTGDDEPYQDMWRLDLASDEWTWIAGPQGANASDPREPGTPGHRASSATWQSGYQLVLYSGYTSATGESDGEMWAFDTTLDTWELVSNTTLAPTPDCGTDVLGVRANAAVWRVPVAPNLTANNNTYGDTDVYLYGGPPDVPSAATHVNIWKLDKTTSQFQCLQNYPDTAFSAGTPVRDFSYANPFMTQPGIATSLIGIMAPTTWVIDSDKLGIWTATNTPTDVLPFLIYSISANRWAPMTNTAYGTASIVAASTYPAFTPTPNFPIGVHYAWVDRTIYQDGRPMVVCLNDAPGVALPAWQTAANTWAYDYDYDTWTWFIGSMYVETYPQFGARGVPSTQTSVGARTGPIFGTTYGLPYALPAGATPPLTVIGFGKRISTQMGTADVWTVRSSTTQQPPLLPPATATPVFGEVGYNWIGGTNGTDATGSYPTNPGEPGTPPGRYLAQSWTYVPPDGGPSTLYVYGGRQPGGPYRLFADMWKFNTVSRQWIWLGGPQGPSSPGGQAADWPGTLSGALPWRIGSRLYMYGGNNNTEDSEPATWNLWYYDVTTETTWTQLPSPQLPDPEEGDTACNLNVFGSRRSASMWHVPSETEYGVIDAVYAYGGVGDLHPGGTSKNNIWQWNETDTSWVCLQDYGAIPAQEDVAGFRNFNTSILGWMNRPGHTVFSSAWVYNSTLLILQPQVGGALWGYDVTVNRWAVVSTPNTATPVYPPDATANPGPGMFAFPWTDYRISPTGEPLLMLLGDTRAEAALVVNTSPVMRANLWGYSYLEDTWYLFNNGYGLYIGGPTYQGPGTSIGSRVGGCVFAGEQTPLAAVTTTGITAASMDAPNVYIGLGSPEYQPTTPSPEVFGVVPYNDVFAVIAEYTPPQAGPTPPGGSQMTGFVIWISILAGVTVLSCCGFIIIGGSRRYRRRRNNDTYTPMDADTMEMAPVSTSAKYPQTDGQHSVGTYRRGTLFL